MSKWIGLHDKLDELEHFGIIYRITNLINNRKYIGKKQLWSKIKKPPLKGNKRKRIITKPSDYEQYYGSSEELKKDILQYGKENFKREVLQYCSCKWELAYCELQWQLKENVLIRDDYYNGIVNLRIGKVPNGLKEKYVALLDNIELTDTKN